MALDPQLAVSELVPQPEPWMSVTESEAAWMSVRDAGIVQALLVMAGLTSSPLRVLEWGAGRSTLAFSAQLERFGIPISWLSIEHHREFFLEEVGPELGRRSQARYVLAEDVGDLVASPVAPGITVVVFDAGELRPFERGDASDFDADLDAYVSLPRGHGWSFDIAIVDGRKRRRCLLAAAELLAPGGIAVLHDGWRRHYQSSFSAYDFGCPLGDELWIGAHAEPGVREWMPPHVFGDHAPEWTTSGTAGSQT